MFEWILTIGLRMLHMLNRKIKSLLSVTIIAGLVSIVIPITICDGMPQTESKIDYAWNVAFGTAVLDWLVDPDTESITIEADWSSASWGLGAEILLKEPINLRDVAEIEITAYTNNDSSTKIYAMVATPDDANLSFPPVRAYPVTSVPEKFTFSVDKLVSYKPDTTSKNFKDEDWQRVDRVKFILTKPATYAQERESIVIKDFGIIYRETTSVDVFTNEDTAPSEAEITELAEITEDSDVENPVTQLDDWKADESDQSQVDEIVIVQADVSKEQEIIHFQSLNELMKRYPPDEPVVNVADLDDAPLQGLIFDGIKIYEDGVQQWRTNDNNSKFFLDLTWKNDKSGFVMDFHTSDPIEASGEWYLTFTAKTVDRSKPRLSMTAYRKNALNSPVCSHDGMILKRKWKTFQIPLKQKGKARTQSINDTINKIRLSCLKKKSNSIEKDVIIIKDVQILRK